MPASITVERQIPELFGSPQELQGYWLKITASVSADMPKEIFLFQVNVDGGTTTGDQFINIASPNDIEETPTGSIDADDNPYYRTDTLELTFRSMVELEETWEYIKEDIQGLVDALNSLETLQAAEEVTFS